MQALSLATTVNYQYRFRLCLLERQEVAAICPYSPGISGWAGWRGIGGAVLSAPIIGD